MKRNKKIMYRGIQYCVVVCIFNNKGFSVVIKIYWIYELIVIEKINVRI